MVWPWNHHLLMWEILFGIETASGSSRLGQGPMPIGGPHSHVAIPSGGSQCTVKLGGGPTVWPQILYQLFFGNLYMELNLSHCKTALKTLGFLVYVCV